jgi:membrane-associated phospholipid phosphatase
MRRLLGLGCRVAVHRLHSGSLMRATLVLLLWSSAAVSQPTHKTQLLRTKDVYWSAGFLAASIALSTADTRIASTFNQATHRSSGRDTLARNFAKIQEGTLTFGNLAIWGLGRLIGSRVTADVGLHAAESVVLGSLASQLIRGPLGRSRPHVTDFEDQYDFKPFRGFTDFRYRAFPSIHTASAFAVATVYTLETQRHSRGGAWVIGPVAYALALGPGISRVYTGQHWASDILAGAFMGTLAGVVVTRYNHDVRPDNRLNRWLLGGDARQASISFSRAF